MTDQINGPFGRRADRGDADVHSIRPYTRAARDFPLRAAGRGCGPRPGEADDPALRASHGNVVPAFIRRFVKTQHPIVHDDSLRRCTREIQRRAGRIHPRAVIDE